MKCYFLKEEFLLKECELFVILFLRMYSSRDSIYRGGVFRLAKKWKATAYWNSRSTVSAA